MDIEKLKTILEEWKLTATHEHINYYSIVEHAGRTIIMIEKYSMLDADGKLYPVRSCALFYPEDISDYGDETADGNSHLLIAKLQNVDKAFRREFDVIWDGLSAQAASEQR